MAPEGADAANAPARPTSSNDLLANGQDGRAALIAPPIPDHSPAIEERAADLLPTNLAVPTADGEQVAVLRSELETEGDQQPTDGLFEESFATQSGESETSDDAGDVNAAEAPVKSRGTREERAAERARRRQQVVGEAIDGEDKNPAMGPIIRHLNTVTKELTVSNRMVGQLTAERDAFRRQVFELQGLPLPEEQTARQEKAHGSGTGNRESRMEARAEAKQARQEAHGEEPSLSPEEVAAHLRKMARRRRLIAVVALGVIAVLYVVLNQRGFDWGSFSRDSFASIAFIGPFFQVFLIGFVFYRMIRVGGRAGKWLFPGDDELKRQRRKAARDQR